MARLPQPDTATSQFFINVQDNLSLNGNAQMGSPGYAVFGKVIDGLDVVDAIKLVRTSRMGPHEAVPVEAVVIVKTAKLSEDEAKKHIEARRAAKTAPSEGQSAGGADTGKSAGGNGEKKADAPGK